MRRSLGFVLAFVVAASAGAAHAAKPPSFRVTIEAKRTTTWAGSWHFGECITESGQGSETTTFRTVQPATLPLAALLHAKPGQIKVAVRSTRAGAASQSFGSSACILRPDAICHPKGDALARYPADPVPCTTVLRADDSGCGTREREPSGSGVYLGYGEDGRFVIQLNVEGSLWGTGCPGVFGPRPYGVFDFSSLPPHTFLDKPVTVLKGSSDGVKCGAGGCPPSDVPFTTHAEWTIRFERVR